jgi:hypothetical protein
MQRGSVKKTSDEKKRQLKKTQMASAKKSSDEKVATPKNENGLIKKISEGKGGTCKAQKFPTNIHVYRSQLR